jgi:hypothetical protein
MAKPSYNFARRQQQLGCDGRQLDQHRMRAAIGPAGFHTVPRARIPASGK